MCFIKPIPYRVEKSRLCSEGQREDVDLTVSTRVAVLMVKMAIYSVLKEKPQSSRQLWPRMALMIIEAYHAVCAIDPDAVKTSTTWKKVRNYFYKKGKRTPRNSIAGEQ